MKLVRIGTRNSQLALWQAEFVRAAILKAHPDCRVELVEILSEGDRTLDIPLYNAGGKGLFLKELETALLDGSIDLAVHSMKDVTVSLPDGLAIPVVCEREDPRDAFVSNRYASFNELPPGARVGTCSLRRKCQLAEARPDLELANLRGNVNTRLAKLDAGEYDAIILAAAGLIRLDMAERIAEALAPSFSLPAVGQGIVGIECRQDDTVMRDIIAPLNSSRSQVMVRAEREVNRILEGGCHAPLASFAEIDGQDLRLRGLVGTVDGTRVLRSDHNGTVDNPEALGERVARELIAQGALEIIALRQHDS